VPSIVVHPTTIAALKLLGGRGVFLPSSFVMLIALIEIDRIDLRVHIPIRLREARPAQ
jgi:hypothetical protein